MRLTGRNKMVTFVRRRVTRVRRSTSRDSLMAMRLKFFLSDIYVSTRPTLAVSVEKGLGSP